MKKPLIGFALILLLVSCSPEGDQDEPTTASVESGVAETVSAERTIDLMGESPFEMGVGKVIAGKWIDDGETVYLLSDGEELENKMKNSIPERDKEAKKTEELTGQKIDKSSLQLKTYENSIDPFAKNILRDYPDMDEYIDKLREANEAIKSGDQKTVEANIKEARALRESQ